MASFKLQALILTLAVAYCLAKSHHHKAQKKAVAPAKPAPPAPQPAKGKPITLAMTTIEGDDALSTDKAFTQKDDHTHDPAGTVTIPFPPTTLSLSKPEEIKLPDFTVPSMPALKNPKSKSK